MTRPDEIAALADWCKSGAEMALSPIQRDKFERCEKALRLSATSPGDASAIRGALKRLIHSICNLRVPHDVAEQIKCIVQPEIDNAASALAPAEKADKTDYKALFESHEKSLIELWELLGAAGQCDAIGKLKNLVAAPEKAGDGLAERISERLSEGDGHWKSCSGCYESNEGYPIGTYSNTFRCELGGGCSECGGIGAVWDNTDYSEIGTVLATPTPPSADVRKDAIEECMKVIDDLRSSGAGMFDAMHSGQRGQDRADAIYDAYHELRKLIQSAAHGSGTEGGEA